MLPSTRGACFGTDLWLIFCWCPDITEQPGPRPLGAPHTSQCPEQFLSTCRRHMAPDCGPCRVVTGRCIWEWGYDTLPALFTNSSSSCSPPRSHSVVLISHLYQQLFLLHHCFSCLLVSSASPPLQKFLSACACLLACPYHFPAPYQSKNMSNKFNFCL